MKVTINSPLITSGFAVKSKAGLQLFVNLENRTMDLVCTCSSAGEVTFSYADDDYLAEYKLHEITFTAESDDERELLKDTLRFELFNKGQHQFILVKYGDLEELK